MEEAVKTQIRMPNSVDPDETAHDEPSQWDRHCIMILPLRTQAYSNILEVLPQKKKKKKKKKKKIF